MKDKKFKYKVINSVSIALDAEDAQPGDIVEMTERAAADRVNKVQLLSEWQAEQEVGDEKVKVVKSKKNKKVKNTTVEDEENPNYGDED